MLRAILPWLVFFGGLALEFGLDYALRIRDGDVRTGGIPQPLWFAILWALAAIALWLAYEATGNIAALWKRLSIVALQAAVAFFLYAAMAISYVCGAGIDCF